MIWNLFNNFCVGVKHYHNDNGMLVSSDFWFLFALDENKIYPSKYFLTLNSCGVLFFGQVPVSNISFRIQLLVRDFSQVFKNFLTQLKKM